VASGDYAFGIQPGGSDWAPGTVTLRIENNTGGIISSLSLSYRIYYYNDQARANLFNFSHSSDDVSYTSETSLNFTSPEAASGSSWQYVDRNITIAGLNIGNGSYYYLRWSGDDVSGSGNRDEFAIDDITINVENRSDIIINSGWSEPQNIPYLSYLATNGLTTGNSVETGSFTIRDGAGANDSDVFSTKLTDITFEIDKFENVQAIAIFDGTTNVSEVTTVNATVDFSGLSLEAPDGGEKDFSIRITFKTTVTDKENLKFTITSATADPSGSVFVNADAGGAETNNIGNNNKIEVIADQLAINTPSSVYVNNNFTVTVSAVDVNGNTDLDEASSVTLALNSGTGSLTSLTGLTQNLINGTHQWTDVQYNVAEVFKIEAQSAGLTNIVSNNITALSSPYIDLIISEIADPSDSSSAKFVEIYNYGGSDVNFSNDTWYLSREANAPNGGWCNIQLQGSISSGEIFVIANDDGNPPTAFPNVYGFEADQYSGCISGNGNDSYYLYYGGDYESGTLIDAFGEQGVNGFGELWEYEDSKATRKRHINAPNSTWTAAEWVIIPATADEMTPKWHDKALIWNGGSSDWNTNTNWTYDGNPATYPPDAGCYLTIPDLSNDPEISGRASCNKMTIESGAVVTVSPNHFLVTGSDISNDNVNGLIVASNSTGDGMLLLGSGTTQATVKRYLSDDMSHFISAPITNNEATADNLFQGHDPEVYLYEFHEDDNSYNYLVPTSTPMPSGKGFSTWVADATGNYITANFDGTLMSSNLTLNGSTTPSLEYTDDSHGWNLVGNPYPVPLDWTRGSWDSTNVEGTIYIWDPDVNNTNNPDGTFVWKNSHGAGTSTFNVIPGGQAFFIRTQATGASLTIPSDARSVYYNQPYYKAPREDEEDSIPGYPADYVIVKVLNEQDEDEVWISFNEYGKALTTAGMLPKCTIHTIR